MTSPNPIKRGDTVTILNEFQDPGDDTFQWQAVSDEDGGRIDIMPIGTNLSIPPICTVKAAWLVRVNLPIDSQNMNNAGAIFSCPGQDI